jgi:hypothetical protein
VGEQIAYSGTDIGLFELHEGHEVVGALLEPHLHFFECQVFWKAEKPWTLTSSAKESAQTTGTTVL